MDILSEASFLHVPCMLVTMLSLQAALAALTEDIEATTVTQEHFVKALDSVKPSLNEQLVQQYSNKNMSMFKHTRRK